MKRLRFFTLMTLLVVMSILPCGIGHAVPAALQVDPVSGLYIPDYYTTPNWANSPPLQKFVNTLPGLGAANANNILQADGVGQYISVAVPDKVTYPGSDYYEIELRQFSEKMHQDLNPTKLRGYVQTNSGTATTACTAPVAGAPAATDCTAANNTVAPAPIRYLGPLIVAQKDRPVRVKFKNALTAADGNLFLPIDTTIMGSGGYEINYDPDTNAPIATRTGNFSTNRATLHLHGGRTPWISDGTAHQWTNPAYEDTGYNKGTSVAYVPDMWYDAAGNTITACAGLTACTVAGATNNPGPGLLTFYWTNAQSSRLMFYHDHAMGITRLNVYAGEAAGYIVRDPVETALVSGGTVNGRTFAAGTIPSAEIPLIIQDKTFVNAGTTGIPTMTSDPTWAWGSNPAKPVTTAPVTGDLWWPHVYMPAENPDNPNMTGINDVGRWVYSPWFFPPVPVCVSGGGTGTKPWCISEGPKANPYYDPTGVDLTQPPFIPGTPLPSTGAEAFMDTMMVNGTVYPTVTLDPKPYRFRILNAAHDRFVNLQWYQAVSKTGYTNPTLAPYVTTGAATDLTEVAMVPASTTPPACSATVPPALPPAGCFPDLWPRDGREGGVPDPAMRGPAFIQIANEGGFLPAPAVLPNQPVKWNVNPTMFNVGNVLQQNEGGGTLIMGPAVRADVIVDFTNFAGKTLILYNDAPTAFPALVPQYDYYTGAPDRTAEGGYTTVLPGFGPNIRTIMQVTVSGGGGTAPVDDYNPTILANLVAAFTTTPVVAGDPTTGPGAFKSSQDEIIVAQGSYTDPAGNFYGTNAYSTAYGKTPGYSWAAATRGIYSNFSLFSLGYQNVAGVAQTTPLTMKAMHDEMGGVFDDYGRMSAKLGVENPLATAANATFIMQQFVDPATELVTPNAVQIWRINHNGVDTHPIHFHLFDVQLINRIGWDGFSRLPDPNELGWKDTIHVNPLEDTIVALKPIVPPTPFLAKIPNSVRPLNPTTPIGTDMGFTQVNVTNGVPLTPPLLNQLVNFGHEYTWHCHILSHEENDMMRPVILAVPPEAPTLAATSSSGNGNNRQVNLNWTKNSLNATGFTVQRATNAAFTTGLVTTVLGDVASYGDRIGTSNATYYYRVFATNTVGGPAPYPVTALDSAFSATQVYPPPPVPPAVPNAPSNVTASVAAAGASTARVTLTWTDNSNNETGFTIQYATDAAFSSSLVIATVTANTTTWQSPTLPRNINYYFRIQAVDRTLASAWVNATPFPVSTTIVVTAPAAPSNVVATGAQLGGGSRITLTWTDNANNETGFTIQRSTNATFVGGGLATYTVGANTTTWASGFMPRGVAYYFRVQANNGALASPWVNALPSPIVTP